MPISGYDSLVTHQCKALRIHKISFSYPNLAANQADTNSYHVFPTGTAMARGLSSLSSATKHENTRRDKQSHWLNRICIQVKKITFEKQK